MTDLGPWATEDFERLSWHDVHVHGLRLEGFVPEHGSADLLLDIDYLLRWEPSGSGFAFTVCQALLRFEQVFGLRITLDYLTPTAGMCPFSIDGVERTPIESVNGRKSYRWSLPVNWPSGSIEFDSPGFTQRLVGQPSVQSEQFLAPDLRRNAADA